MNSGQADKNKMPTRRKISSQYKAALAELTNTASAELTQLLELWPEVKSKIDAQWEERGKLFPASDPLRQEVDLLTPLGRVLDENTHTRAIAYILDPNGSHKLGLAGLSSLLKMCKRSVDTERLKALISSGADPRVIPEYQYRVGSVGRGLVRRCDVWVEIKAEGARGLIVLENKINALEGDGQLNSYEEQAARWCAAHSSVASLRLFLTPDGRSPTSAKAAWECISYARLAGALREIWERTGDAVVRSWLGMYITSITRGVLAMDPYRPERDQIGEYLGAHVK
jgi:hypothetical protein